MFERYTEEARRSLFFSRYEATLASHTTIEPEHLLLGLARIHRVGAAFGHDGLATLRTRLAAPASRQMTSTAVEIPFSATTKRALTLAADLADEAQHAWIGPEHLMAGLSMIEGARAAALIHEAGLTRERLLAEVVPPDARPLGPLEQGTRFGVPIDAHLGDMLLGQELRTLADEFFIATDRKDWARARALFADGAIEVDMTSIAGGNAVQTTADELIAGFRAALHHGKTSHHMTSNYHVTIQPDRQAARAFCHAYAWNRVALFAPGDDLWETWGTYEFGFGLTHGQWRIVQFTYVSKLARGNDAVRTHLGDS